MRNVFERDISIGPPPILWPDKNCPAPKGSWCEMPGCSKKARWMFEGVLALCEQDWKDVISVRRE